MNHTNRRSIYRTSMGVILLAVYSGVLICEEAPETERAIVAHALAQAHNQEYLAAELKRISEMDTEVVRCAVDALEMRLGDLQSDRAVVAALRLFRRHTGRLPDGVRIWAEGMKESNNQDVRSLAIGLLEFQEHIKNEAAKKGSTKHDLPKDEAFILKSVSAELAEEILSARSIFDLVGIDQAKTTACVDRLIEVMNKKQWVEEPIYLGVLRVLQKYDGSLSAKQFEFVSRTAENKSFSPLTKRLAAQIRDLSKKEAAK